MLIEHNETFIVSCGDGVMVIQQKMLIEIDDELILMMKIIDDLEYLVRHGYIG